MNCRVSDVMSLGGYNCKASWGQLRIKQLNQTNTLCGLLHGGERIKERERGGGIKFLFIHMTVCVCIPVLVGRGVCPALEETPQSMLALHAAIIYNV